MMNKPPRINAKEREQREQKKLTPEQIANWRNVLAGMIGSYAYLIPDADIEAMRNNLEAQTPRGKRGKP